MKLGKKILIVIDTFLLGVIMSVLAFSFVFKATHFIYDMYMDVMWRNQMVVLIVASYVIIRLAHYTITEVVKEVEEKENEFQI